MVSSRGIGLSVIAVVCLAAPIAGAWDTNNWQFVDAIERANLRFFQEQKRGPYDLLIDTADYDATYPNPWPPYSSVAGIGFELSAICIGHYRGWISFSNAYEQVLKPLRFFTGQLSTNPLVGERVNGWTFHTYWLNDDGTNAAGTRFYMPDGLSFLDHSLLIAGCIFVSEYFKGTEAGELAAKLYRETTWSWRPNSDYNFGYSENLLGIVESAEAPQYAKGIEAHNIWDLYCTPPWPRTLQLYFWQYPHAYVDFRFRWDFRGENHAIIAQQSILYQRERAIAMHNADPVKYDMIGSNCWGWTAATPSDWYRQMAPWPLWLGEYYDEEHASDSGSITPMGLPGCMVYAGTETMACMKHIFEQYYLNGSGGCEHPVWSDRYGFINCFNTGKPWRYYTDSWLTNWSHPVNAGIDYGPNVLLLENYKLGTTWRWFMQNPSISNGMNTIGLGAQQNVTLATFSNQVNEFGGSIWTWQNPPYTAVSAWVMASPTNAFVKDYAARFSANGPTCGGAVNLGGSDQRAKAVLSFWVKGETGQEGIRVGLVDNVTWKENKVTLADYTGGLTPTNWTEVKIPIEKFCLTGNVTNDTWPGSLVSVTFEFTNSGGGSIDIDYLAFTSDTIAPVRPTNAFGVAMAGNRARVCWEPAGAERDVVGYHVWRRLDATSGFTRVTSTLVPAYKGVYEDTNFLVAASQEVRYAVQAFDNAEPQHSSSFALEKKALGGRFDVDWNNGCNPNVFGGTGDGFWGSATVQAFGFTNTILPDGSQGWARRSYVDLGGSGHYIDMAGADVSDYWALSFDIRGTDWGNTLQVGLRDTNGRERQLPLAYYIGGSLSTNWTRVVMPLSDFTNVTLSSLSNISFLHETAGEIELANICFIPGQRSLLVNTSFTEAEDWTRQYGSPSEDVKAGASGGLVLGQGWSIDGGDYADYEFYLAHSLNTPTLRVRYACNAGNGRALEVRRNDVLQGLIVGTNTAGWGESSNHFSWTTLALPSITSGYQKLTFYASGYDEPLNLDCWELIDSISAARECEDYTSQVGSGGQDMKAGASGGEVLGEGWGMASNSEAVYADVDVGSHTGAWLHVWYACGVVGGRVVNVYVDGQYRARLNCAGTRGWGSEASHFDRASAQISALAGGPHTIRFAVPGPGDGVNLDCFYIGDDAPVGLALDTDGDGLSDRQEGVAGTAATTVDSDGDGIADGDEVQFGRSGQVSDPSKADTDDDGMSDLEEAISGTDPNNESEFFQWLENSVESFPTLGRILRWSSATGRFYSISVSTNLPDFWPLTSGLPATPTMNVWTDTVSPDSPTLIYRIDAHR